MHGLGRLVAAGGRHVLGVLTGRRLVDGTYGLPEPLPLAKAVAGEISRRVASTAGIMRLMPYLYAREAQWLTALENFFGGFNRSQHSANDAGTLTYNVSG